MARFIPPASAQLPEEVQHPPTDEYGIPNPQGGALPKYLMYKLMQHISPGAGDIGPAVIAGGGPTWKPGAQNIIMSGLRDSARMGESSGGKLAGEMANEIRPGVAKAIQDFRAQYGGKPGMGDVERVLSDNPVGREWANWTREKQMEKAGQRFHKSQLPDAQVIDLVRELSQHPQAQSTMQQNAQVIPFPRPRKK